MNFARDPPLPWFDSDIPGFWQCLFLVVSASITPRPTRSDLLTPPRALCEGPAACCLLWQALWVSENNRWEPDSSSQACTQRHEPEMRRRRSQREVSPCVVRVWCRLTGSHENRGLYTRTEASPWEGAPTSLHVPSKLFGKKEKQSCHTSETGFCLSFFFLENRKIYPDSLEGCCRLLWGGLGSRVVWGLAQILQDRGTELPLASHPAPLALLFPPHTLDILCEPDSGASTVRMVQIPPSQSFQSTLRYREACTKWQPCLAESKYTVPWEHGRVASMQPMSECFP